MRNKWYAPMLIALGITVIVTLACLPTWHH
jgi:hypothetical protein